MLRFLQELLKEMLRALWCLRRLNNCSGAKNGNFDHPPLKKLMTTRQMRKSQSNIKRNPTLILIWIADSRTLGRQAQTAIPLFNNKLPVTSADGKESPINLRQMRDPPLNLIPTMDLMLKGEREGVVVGSGMMVQIRCMHSLSMTRCWRRLCSSL